MEIDNLQEHIRTLATLPETESPVISCYLDLTKGITGYTHFILERSRLLGKGLEKKTHEAFQEALQKINKYLEVELDANIKSIALYSRGGSEPFFLPLPFRLPLQNWMGINGAPYIYPLIELKDQYYRFVVVISTEESARILEINLGDATESVWEERPDLIRKEGGRNWTKEHYQHNRKDRADRYIKEKIKILDQIISKGHYAHLILAGSPHQTARMRKALPKHLADIVIDTVVIAKRAKTSAVVEATLSSFIEQEKKESLAAVERLKNRIYSNGLAVVGVEHCMKALENGQVDTLILSKDFEDRETQEEMVKMAVQKGSSIETVSDSFLTHHYAGVGCLLRFRLPDEYM